VDQLPQQEGVAKIESKVDLAQKEAALMAEAIKKFADPEEALLALVAETRRTMRAGPAGDGSPQDRRMSPALRESHNRS
jgi:hypothetical protein